MSASDASGAACSATNASEKPGLLTAAAAETLLATMPLGVLALTAAGTVAVLNPAAEALWGVPTAAVLGHAPAQVQPAVLPPELVQALAEAAPAAGPYWLPHTQQWVTLRTAPAAEASRWVYWDNVTASQPPPQAVPPSEPATPNNPEHQRLQAALHQAQEQYRRLFEAMAQGFCIVEVLFDETQQPVDYRFLVTNPAFAQETGLGDVVGQTMRTLRPQHEARWFEVYGHIAHTGEPQRFAHVAEQLGRFYAVYAFRVGNPAEHQVAILFSDLSGVQRTEQALRESEESYRTLFNSIDEGYLLCDVLFDPQGVPVDMLYLDANPAATHLLGADFRGKRLRELDPTYESYWFEIFGRVARTGVGERLERYAEPDKKWYNFYVFKAGNEASHRVAVVFQDITTQKQHEQALRASEAQVAADLAGMRRLYELQAKLADQDDVQAALRDVLAAACEFTGTDRGCVQLLSRDGQRLEMAVWQGYPDDSPFISFFRYEGLETGCEVTRVQRQRLIIEDTVGFEGLEGTEAGAATHADGIRAAQSTPLTSRSEETIGVISTQFRQPHRPSDHALRLLDMLAWTAAEFLERHRAEVARRESEQQFRLLADAVPQIVWLTDAEGRVEFLNQQWSDYTGVPYEPTTAAKMVASFVHPDDEAATMDAFTAARATGTTLLVEHRIRSRAGDYRWFLVRAEPHRAADTDQVSRWFGASVDIHDRKQAEVALEKAHERLQLALNVGRIFSFEMNPATRQLDLSDNVDLVMGFPLPDHIDSTFELIHPDDLQPTVDLINGAIDARGSYASEYRLVNPANGDVVWFHSQAAFTRSNASGEWRFVGIAQNITASKRAEETLRASEALLQKAFSIDTVGVLFFSVEGRMTAANEAFARLSGYSREELLTVPASVLTPPEFAAVTARALGELAEQGETAPYEKQVQRPDGSRWWALCSPTRLRGHGQAAECVEFVLDISERKQAEEQLRVLMATLEQQVAARTQDLRASQQLLQLVFDTSLMAMSVQEAVRDANGDIQDFRVVFLNQELARELGRADMVGKHYVQEYPGLQASGLLELMCATVETGEPQQTEYYYPYEGFNRWFSCTFVKLGDGLVATNLDITPRKQAEEKMREQAHFIARVNETSPDLMTVIDLASGQVLYVNRDPHEPPSSEREKLLNLPRWGQTGLLQMHPDDVALLSDYFTRAAALADHEIATYSYRAKFGADQWHWFEVRGSVFQRDPATGAATQILSVAQDVTSQKEAELQQAKSHQLLQQSEEVASLGSWDYDRRTGEFQWSAGMYQLFGLAPGSPIRPATYLDFVVPDDQPAAERLVRGLLEGRTDFDETLRIQVGAAVKTLRVKAAVVLDEAGEPLRVLGVDLDISEVQRLEADNLRLRLTQQQALFEAVQQAQETERKHIAEGLHNGVGQLLFATKLRLDMLHTPVLDTQPALAAARKEADRLLGEAIRQTRVLSHELVPTVLADFGLAAAFQAIGQQLSTPQLQLRCQVVLDEDVAPLPALLQLALYRMAQELGLNIVKHARGATEASLELETTPGFVLLRAEDNGAGFAADAATSPGLGLRTIRDRVALLNGMLDLGHVAGLGTFVRLRIPLPTASLA